MFKILKNEVKLGNEILSIESGKIARQSRAAVTIKYGNTVLLCTVNTKKTNIFSSFVPLTVNYQEKSSAAGKIPGGFFKREGKPSEDEVLISRLIDRSIRPLFDNNYGHDIQVVVTVLSYDKRFAVDSLAIIGVSSALAISGIPITNNIAAARIGYIDGQYTLNLPDPESKLDLIISGTKNGIVMIESSAETLTEDQVADGIEFGHKNIKEIIACIEEFKKLANTTIDDIAPHNEQTMIEDMLKQYQTELEQAYCIKTKQERKKAISIIKDKIKIECAAKVSLEKYEALIDACIFDLEYNIARNLTINTKLRLDGRKYDEIRQISGETKFLPMAHGSALFTRGETQVISTVTLGTEQDEQIIDSLDGSYKERFMLHYNFPPYCVGEIGRLGAPGRREVGHGKLAWRGINKLIPSKQDFPYTIRVVAEVTESNGSSSMATVCSTIMALMDTGVPIKEQVAGIAMGLIKHKNGHVVLSDISGDEDHLGDMDFKVIGNEKGITALQMDIKIDSVNLDLIKSALAQAKTGYLHILNEMNKVIDQPNDDLSENAPQIVTISINESKIKDLIGPGGKQIKLITEVTNVKIDIEDNGKVNIASSCQENLDKAIEMINEVTQNQEPKNNLEEGSVYEGKITKIVDFGIFVSIEGSRDGLVHISQVANKRITLDGYAEVGEKVWVEYIGSDHRGKIRLSMKTVDQDSGKKYESSN